MQENYEKVLNLCKVMIERDYAPCGLEEDVKKRLLELTQELERRGRRGFNIISVDVFRAVNQAESYEKRFKKGPNVSISKEDYRFHLINLVG